MLSNNSSYLAANVAGHDVSVILTVINKGKQFAWRTMTDHMSLTFFSEPGIMVKFFIEFSDVSNTIFIHYKEKYTIYIR